MAACPPLGHSFQDLGRRCLGATILLIPFLRALRWGCLGPGSAGLGTETSEVSWPSGGAETSPMGPRVLGQRRGLDKSAAAAPAPPGVRALSSPRQMARMLVCPWSAASQGVRVSRAAGGSDGGSGVLGGSVSNQRPVVPVLLQEASLRAGRGGAGEAARCAQEGRRSEPRTASTRSRACLRLGLGPAGRSEPAHPPSAVLLRSLS